ncbi:MAG: pyrimidine reductase family protein [Mycobacteriaceae bacterium]
MHHLNNATQLTIYSDSELRDLYAYPPSSGPYVRANFISSLDGTIAVSGRSGELGSPGDKVIFEILRELADVVLVGAHTATIEGYRGAQLTADQITRRLANHQTHIPPIAVVSAKATISPQAPLLTDTTVPPLIFTLRSADSDKKQALAEAGAELIECSGSTVTAREILATCAERGLSRILCEGGPRLFSHLVSEGAVNELCLTTAPRLLGGESLRILSDNLTIDTPAEQLHLLTDAGGYVYSRWGIKPPH